MDVQRFFNEHSELSLASLETLRVILGNMFKIATINGLCTRNPVEDIRLNSSYLTEERKAYNEKQQRIAMDWCIKNNEYAILTILKTGIRRGELCGLRPCDINIDNKTISINRSMSPKTTDDDYIDYSLKTKCSKRIVPIDDELCDILMRMLDNTPKNKYAY